jgi:hypothetical protein
MKRLQNQSKSRAISSTFLKVAICSAAALSVGGTFVLFTPSPVSAKPEFAAQTGLPCGQCHVNPAGGGDLKAFGKKFKANGFKVK